MTNIDVQTEQYMTVYTSYTDPVKLYSEIIDTLIRKESLKLCYKCRKTLFINFIDWYVT